VHRPIQSSQGQPEVKNWGQVTTDGHAVGHERLAEGRAPHGVQRVVGQAGLQSKKAGARVRRFHFSHRCATWGRPAFGVEAMAAGNIGFDTDKLRTFACPTDAIGGMTASDGSMSPPPGTALCHPVPCRCTRVCTLSCMASRWRYMRSSALQYKRTNREQTSPFQAPPGNFMIRKSGGHPTVMAGAVRHIRSKRNVVRITDAARVCRSLME
jgi:hypothetical protein